MNSIAEILGVPRKRMQELEKTMESLGFEPVLDRVAEENQELIKGALIALGVKDGNAEDVFVALLKKAEKDEAHISNLHRGDISKHFVAEILRQANITPEDWDKA